MNDQQSPAPAETEAPAVTESLENIAKELTVEEQVKQYVSNAVPPPLIPQQVPMHSPDPVTDPAGYAAFMQRNNQIIEYLANETRQLAERQNQWERDKVQQKNNSDVDKAVSKVNANLNLDSKLTQALLEVEYQHNPSFRKIWDNRERNPQAVDRALDVLSKQFAGKFSVKQDPNIAKNLAAAKSAQQTMATTANNSQTEDLRRMSDAEFDSWWARQRGN